MDQILKEAAATGNVSKFYELITINGNILRHLDEVEFIDTPLHTAAENGQIGFAMEMINLKSSFARKLNHQGLSPLHVAVEKGQVKMALRLLEVDKDFVRVRGKNGETPFHCLIKDGKDIDMLDKFMKACPECIRDVTIQNRTALHIAVENRRLEVLQVLIRSLKNINHYEEVVNRQDEDGNTALHIAASSNQTEMLALLLKFKADKHLRNHEGKTTLDVAHDTQSIRILGGCFLSPKISNYRYVLKKKIVKYVTNASSLIFHDMDNISGEDRNALLVVLGLLLTATYQAALSPPGGLWQGDANSNSDSVQLSGTTVMNRVNFLFFYIPNYLVFIVTYFLILALLKPYPRGIRTTLQVLLAFLAICFVESISFIAPVESSNRLSASGVISIFGAIVFFLMVFMFIANDVSKFSVSILACWNIPFQLFVEDYIVAFLLTAAVQGLLLFIFLYDEFWMGSIFVVCFGLYESLDDISFSSYSELVYPVVFLGKWLGLVVLLGSWLLFHLCHFCIKRRTQICNRLCIGFQYL